MKCNLFINKQNTYYNITEFNDKSQDCDIICKIDKYILRNCLMFSNSGKQQKYYLFSLVTWLDLR